MGSTNHPRIHFLGFPDQLGGHGTTDGSHGIGFEGTNLCRLVVGCQTWHVKPPRRCKEVWFGWKFTKKGEEKKHIAKINRKQKTRYNMCIPFEKNIALVGKDCRCSDLLTLDETGKLQRDCHEVKKYPTQPAKWTRMRRKRHPPFIHPQIWSTFSVVGIPLFDQTMHRWTPKCCATLSLNLVMGGSFYREDGHQWANIWIWCDICIFLYMQYKMYM